MNHQDRGRLDYLDSLRGWAILGVFVIHCGSHFDGTWVRDWTSDGGTGVQLFYTLSAITLFYTGRSQHSGERTFVRNFFIRRFFRIAPLFYPVLTLYFIRSTLWNFGSPPDHHFTVGRYLADAAFVNGFIPEYLVPRFGEWSIAIEMTFYLMVPLLLRWIKDADRALYLTVFALLLDAGFTEWSFSHSLIADRHIWDTFRFFGFFNQFPAFTCGIWTYYLLQRPIDPKRATPFMVFGLFWGYVTWMNRTTFYWGLPHTLQYEVTFMAMVVSLHLRKRRFFVNRAMSHLGRVSFSCYLLHNTVKDLISPYIMGLHLPPLPGFLVMITAVGGLSCALATLSYRYIELPGIALGKRLIVWLDSRGAAPVPALAEVRSTGTGNAP
jgi:peptidoglycan/LPS O-acetylase OafA/YrhL